MSRIDQEDRDLYTLIGRYESFSQQVLQELKEIKTRQDTLEAKIDETKTVCPYHEDLSEEVKKQGEKITVLEKSDAVQEVKLDKKQEQQLNLTTIGTIGNWIYTGIKIILTIFGINLP